MVRPLNVLCFKSLFSDKLLEENLIVKINESAIIIIDNIMLFLCLFTGKHLGDIFCYCYIL
jgi:hypothetical protein